MIKQLARFMAETTRTVYPEPRSPGHDAITAKMFPEFAAKLPAGATVLDIGCGKGPALDLMAKAGFRGIGITLSPEDVRDCVAAGHDCREMDQHAMHREWSGFFDGVWARHIAEHSPAPLFALMEYARVLKPGGWLYLECPAPGTVAAHCGNANHYSVLTPDMWGGLLKKAGFTGYDTFRALPLNLACGPDLYFAFTCQKPL